MEVWPGPVDSAACDTIYNQIFCLSSCMQISTQWSLNPSAKSQVNHVVC